MQIYCKDFSGPLTSYITDYIKFIETLGYKNKSYLFALKSLDNFLKNIQVKSIKEINQSHILFWFTKQKNYKPQSKRQRLSQISNFFKYLQRIDVVKNNPTEGIIIKTTKYQPYIYSLKEICDILAQAKKLTLKSRTLYTGEFYYTFIYLIYATLLRLNETLNVRLKDINLENKTIFIYKGKFGKERLLPISENTRQKLQYFIKLRFKKYPPINDEEPLFCNKYHKVYSKTNIEVQFRKLTKLSGLTTNIAGNPPRIHDLRHSSATHLLHKWYCEGKDIMSKLPLLSVAMGHVDISSTQYYLTITPGLLQVANKLFENKFKKFYFKK